MKLSEVRHELLTMDVRQRLLNNHVIYVHEFLAHNVNLLSLKSGLKLEDIFALRQYIQKTFMSEVKSVEERKNEQFKGSIFSSLNYNYIYELCGPPGSGKTQIALHLSAKMADKGHTVLYVDTKNDFSLDRLSSLTKCTTNVRLAKAFDLDEVLKISASLCKTSTNLESSVKLLVLDNIASLIWPLLEDQNIGQVFGQVALLITNLRRIAHKFNLAVLVINNWAQNRPALGKIFNNAANTRFVIMDRCIRVDRALDRPFGEQMKIVISENFIKLSEADAP